jgi:hypothetical protein
MSRKMVRELLKQLPGWSVEQRRHLRLSHKSGAVVAQCRREEQGKDTSRWIAPWSVGRPTTKPALEANSHQSAQAEGERTMTSEEQRFFDSVIDGLCRQGWERQDAEDEALARVKRNREIDELLEKARAHQMTEEEIAEQRDSWVRGEMGIGLDGEEAAYRFDMKCRKEGWGLVTDQAFGGRVRPSDVKLQAREVARWASDKLRGLKCGWPEGACACAMQEATQPDPFGRVWMHCEEGLTFTEKSIARFMMHCMANGIEVGTVWAFNPRYPRSQVSTSVKLRPDQFEAFEKETGGKLRKPPVARVNGGSADG